MKLNDNKILLHKAIRFNPQGLHVFFINVEKVFSVITTLKVKFSNKSHIYNVYNRIEVRKINIFFNSREVHHKILVNIARQINI